MSPRATGASGAWDALVETCAHLPFEPHDIASQLDARGRYEVPLDGEFAFNIRLFHYSSRQRTRGGRGTNVWSCWYHSSGRAVFRMGNRTVEARGGSLLVVDDLTLHHVVDFRGFDTRAIVVSFRPGSCTAWVAFVRSRVPLAVLSTRRSRRSRTGTAEATELVYALRRLVESRFTEPDSPIQRAGCEAFLLQLLFELSRRFPTSALMHWEFIRQQQRSMRLQALLDHVRDHAAERLTVGQAAAIVA